MNFPTLYEGNLTEIEWIRIMIYTCNYKGIECYVVTIIKLTIGTIDGKERIEK